MSNPADNKEPRPGLLAVTLSALDRLGGYLVAPRRTVAKLAQGVGMRDTLLLGLLYVLGTAVYPVAESVAGLWAMRNLGGVMMVVSSLGRALLIPIVATVIVDTVLGRARAHRDAVGLAPLVVFGVAGHALRQLGVDLPGAAYTPELVGAVFGVAAAAWVRPAVEPMEES